MAELHWLGSSAAFSDDVLTKYDVNLFKFSLLSRLSSMCISTFAVCFIYHTCSIYVVSCKYHAGQQNIVAESHVKSSQLNSL